MAGLLDMFDNGDAQFGLGLLAAAAPRADGAGFGQRLMEGVQYGQQWKKDQAKQKLIDMQMQEAEMKLGEQKRQAELQKWLTANAPKYFTPSAPAQDAKFESVPVTPQAATSIANPMALDPASMRQMPNVQRMVSPAVPATNAAFDLNGFANAYAQQDPLAAIQLLQKDAPIKLGQGEVLIDKNTYKPLFSAPAKAEKDDSKITQYEYARKNGYKGSFEQFVTLGPALMAAAAAPMRDAQIAGMAAENDYKLPPPRKQATSPSVPMVGQVVQGYKFKGGNPADQRNWEKQ